MDDDIWFFNNIILPIVVVLAFIFLTIVLMIPIANVFIAKAVFEEKKEGNKNGK